METKRSTAKQKTGDLASPELPLERKKSTMYRNAGMTFLLALFLLFPATAFAGIDWFGYVVSGDQDAELDGVASYTNWGWFSTDENASNTLATQRINALSQRNMKTIVELGKLLWAPGPQNMYQQLYPDYLARWNTWKAANAGALTSDKVLAFLVRDEPFLYEVNISSFETASQMVKSDFPWAKLILVDNANPIACPDMTCHFNRYRYLTSTFDWIGVDQYAIDPQTNSVFQAAVSKMKQTYPGKKWVYAADGFWDSEHATNFQGADINIMRSIMTKWYNVAKADPDAVLLGVFLFGSLTGGTSSRNFPPNVLEEHTRIGRETTGRVRTQLYQPTGRLEGIDSSGTARGWACDPDGAWGERIRVDFYFEGLPWPVTTYAEKASEFFPQCRTGIAHRFQAMFSIGTAGRRITAYAYDLDSGTVQLPSNCPDAPACIWYTSQNEPKGYMQAISPTGIASGWVCDPDGPQASSKVRLALGNGTLIGIYTTNLSSEQAVADECGGGYTHRFSVQLPSWARGVPIYAYAQDLTSAYEVQIPWLCDQGWYCIWY